MLLDLFSRMSQRNDRRTESEIQADVRQFILSAPFDLEESDVSVVALESQLGDRKRIDVEVGSTVIEVKRDLRKGRVRTEAVEQLANYVATRTTQTGLRYVGVLTDGTEWLCYDLTDGELHQVSSILLSTSPAEVERLVVWLEGVLATAKDIAPTASNIAARLGAESSAYSLDRATLASLYKQHKDEPTVKLKRTLWSRLLTSALGTSFEDTDDLFIEHTLLVNTAEIIAHAMLGLSVGSINPASLLSGEKFDESGIHGVVEPDFFDWVIEIEGGEIFVRTLAKRLSRFDWGKVEQDVLKVLYESVIGSATRQRLGEYYTPDWLADVIVTEAVPNPLNCRVLDPACGSGTFLFHAVRRYIEASEANGIAVGSILESVTRHVIGMDLHPVAVTLARVTYLLAIGRERLTDRDRPEIQIPVYLGDSLQWQEQNIDLWAAGNLVIRADDKKDLFGTELSFPDPLLENASRFDELVNEMANKASSRKKHSPVPSLKAVLRRLAVPEKFQATVEATFDTMCRLHDQDRDHIWGYYIRNLARPLWLARSENRVDVVVGNPPWLAYRKMTVDMQKAFKRMSEARGLWAGAELSTHQDLSGLFAVRACELYLRIGGRFAFVLPNAAIDREHYAPFRKGHYGGKAGDVAFAFDPSWDLRKIRPHFFPRAACVIFGKREEHTRVTADGEGTWSGRKMPKEAQIWSGKLPHANMAWREAQINLTRTAGAVKYVGLSGKSSYAPLFSQGATVLPRLAFTVEPQEASALGLPKGRLAVRSSRSVQEKSPWKNLPSISGVVESEFVRPFYTGDNIYAFRAGEPMLAVLPCGVRSILDKAQMELHPGLHQWWTKAEELWDANRANDRMSLMDRLNYQSTLGKQLPIPPLRVVYNRSGMHVVAAKLRNSRAILGSGLYWAAVDSEDEASYICAILNAPITTELVRPFMTYGKDERDIAKHVWELPVPKYDSGIASHKRLAELGSAAERLVSEFQINDKIHFAASRRHIREILEDTETGKESNELVYEMLA